DVEEAALDAYGPGGSAAVQGREHVVEIFGGSVRDRMRHRVGAVGDRDFVTVGVTECVQDVCTGEAARRTDEVRCHVDADVCTGAGCRYVVGDRYVADLRQRVGGHRFGGELGLTCGGVG